jgi:hypothetical protein
VYSFALKPEEHQPSGTCNFSRIDTAVLQLQLTQKSVAACPEAGATSGVAGVGSAKVRVYAVNYNVLRIMSGIEEGDPPQSLSQKVSNLSFFYDKVNCFWLVNQRLINRRFATFFKCGDLLRASSTKSTEKFVDGQVKSHGFDHLIRGKNDEDWTIRNQFPKFVSELISQARIWKRFRDYKRMGLRRLALFSDNLRYSPSLHENVKFTIIGTTKLCFICNKTGVVLLIPIKYYLHCISCLKYLNFLQKQIYLDIDLDKFILVYIFLDRLESSKKY